MMNFCLNWARSRIKQPCPNPIVQVFSRLMLRGQVRSAVRWLTERMSDGGVLDPLSVSQ